LRKPYFLIVREIAELSNKYHYWKVHLIGDLSINSKTREMLVDIWVVPLNKPQLYETRGTHHRLVNNYYFDFSEVESRRIKIGVGQLPVLLHGTVLWDGCPVAPPRYVTRRFEITPTELNQKIISSGDSWGKWNGKTRYYIPSNQFQIFQKSSDDSSFALQTPYPAKFLVVEFAENEKPQESLNNYPLNQQRWFSERGIKAENNQKPIEGTAPVQGVIFPCLELIRFYMTYSSQSWQEILSDGLAGIPNRFFNVEKTVKPALDGTGGMVMLSKYITDDDRQIVCRPAFDDYALSEFRRPYMSAFNNKLKGGSFLPEARFPFKNQKTKLTVHGTYLQTGNRIYFLVYWISYCTAEFPYRKAAFFRENPGTKTAPQTEVDVSQSTTVIDNEMDNVIGEKFDYEADEVKHLTLRSTEGGEAQSDEPPSKYRGKMMLSLNFEDRFEYPKNYPLNEEQPKTDQEIRGTKKSVNPQFSTIAESQETVATAPASGSESVTPVALIPKTEKTTDSPLVGDWKIREIANPDEKTKKAENDNNQKEAVKETNENQFVEDETGNVGLEIKNEKKQEKNKSNAVKRQNLPVDSYVFKQILLELSRLNKSIEGRMIALPATGDYLPTATATLFPSLLVYSGQVDEEEKGEGRLRASRRTRELPDELFIAEIRTADGHFAYIMDIEATMTQSGNVARSFQMLLYFDRERNQKLTGDDLRAIISKCEENKGKWVGFDSDSNELPEDPKNEMPTKNPMVGCVFKHNMESAEKYAARILFTLTQLGWFN
jgi:hypothetical protein